MIANSGSPRLISRCRGVAPARADIDELLPLVLDGSIEPGDVHLGQTLYTPPGQEYFQAAAEGGFMEHIAMIESGGGPATTTVWLKHITDDYNGR